jgi:Arc/MetJ family transcription regulator
MRTNIDLDDKLVSEAFKYSGAKTKKELITLTLKEFIEGRKRRNLGDLRGKINFIEGYNYKDLRRDSK